MSALETISRALRNTPEGQSEWGHMGRAQQILDELRAMPDSDRIALARALVPEGWVVAEVPDAEEHDERLSVYGNAVADGWNACRAAILASSEETP